MAIGKTGKDPVATLQEGGYRLTPQRMMVLDAVRESEGHVSAEEILRSVRVRYPYANASSVYRTLDLLTKLRLVTQTDLGEGLVRYHYAENGRHHHLICRGCGHTLDMADSDMSSLARKLRDKYGFHADLRHWAIFGLCKGCEGKRA